ncbi:hypothetical protein ACROYT_G010301 [Oculina patagonica]
MCVKMSRGGGPYHKVYVGGLGENGTKEEIEREFEKFGRLHDVWVARNPPGFAFVEFEDLRDAEDAIKELDGKTICGVEVRVEMSKHRGGRGRGGGGGGGGFRGQGLLTGHHHAEGGLPRGTGGSQEEGEADLVAHDDTKSLVAKQDFHRAEEFYVTTKKETFLLKTFLCFSRLKFLSFWFQS